MYNLKSFVSQDTMCVVTENVNGTDRPVIQTGEPCVLLTASELYRIIYGKDKNVSDRVSEFIQNIKSISLLSTYDKALREELSSIELDVYCQCELEDAAFKTGHYKHADFALANCPE